MQFKLSRLFLSALLIGGGSFGADFAAADPPTREDIANLPPEAKATLLKNKEKFEALSAEEQKRLRELNMAITSSPQGPALLTTLDRYEVWLTSLTSKQRSDLLELPPEKRIDRIKELMQEQERSRLRELGGKQLPLEDVDAIFNWLEEYMKTHEDKYLERVPGEDYRKKLREMDEVSRRRSLMRGIIMRGPRSDSPMPMKEDFVRLLPTLTPATRAALESAKTPEEQQQVARQWIFSAMISKVLPPPSEEDLQKIFKDLKADERERLERKSPEDIKRELTWRYHWKGREGWRGPGGPGFGPGRPGGSGSVGAGPGGQGGPGGGGPGRGGDRPPFKRPDPGSGERPPSPPPEVKPAPERPAPEKSDEKP
jgi:hypothetical protein